MTSNFVPSISQEANPSQMPRISYKHDIGIYIYISGNGTFVLGPINWMVFKCRDEVTVSRVAWKEI